MIKLGKKYLVELDRKNCIGSATCAAAAEGYWKMQDDGKINLEGSEKKDNNQKQVREIDESELEKLKLSAEVCPVRVIKIFDKETGEQVA